MSDFTDLHAAVTSAFNAEGRFGLSESASGLNAALRDPRTTLPFASAVLAAEHARPKPRPSVLRTAREQIKRLSA